MGLHIVLFEPQIPQNTGNISRTCAALGAKLHLVEPLGFSLNDRYLKRAGLDYWHLLDLEIHQSVNSFLDEHGTDNLWFFTTKGKTIYSDVVYEDDSFLVFGKETAGIDESILVKYPKRCLRLPMKKESRSLNLSNCVAVGAFEYIRQHRFCELETEGALHRLSWAERELS
ncbi:MAG: tRNA (uridine(34)/cytosine(34)/5-carboxymethylaminomethyluridine(34)-2'-O)-methyltransferase TrmL [Sphaerochaetaceae bacterium]